MKYENVKPTSFNGTLYRSRLEARWAIFFTEMGLKFDYEPRTFILKNGKYYLPDFYLVKYNCFLEIKPEVKILKIWKTKIEEVSKQINYPVLLLVGPPDFKTYKMYFNEQWNYATIEKDKITAISKHLLFTIDFFTFSNTYKSAVIKANNYKFL